VKQSGSDSEASDAACDLFAYGFKPSLFGASWDYRLLPDALAWRAGGRGGEVRYADIKRMRVSFRPVSMQTYRFLTEIWPRRGPKLRVVSSSWRSMVEQQRQGAGYRAFVIELGRRIAMAQPTGMVDTGSAPMIYWTGVTVVAVVALAIAALIVSGLLTAEWAGAAFVSAFLALFLWQAGTFFRRNRPARCRPDALPEHVLPAAVPTERESPT
jgi:hypothetical protein